MVRFLSKVGDDDLGSFAESAAWPDELSENKLKIMQEWHFENIKLRDTGIKMFSEAELGYKEHDNEAINAYVKLANFSVHFIETLLDGL